MPGRHNRPPNALEAIVAAFLKDRHISIRRASFGIAGPVVIGRVQATNLPWVIEEQAFSASLGAPARLLNDLAAIAHAVPNLRAEDLETLNEGAPAAQAPLAVIAPGTGLGEAFLLWTGNAYRPFASEGGHADFAPNTSLGAELLAYLRPRLGHVSYEHVCSGRGLPNLYGFLHDTGRYTEPAWLAAELAAARDPTRVIVRAGVAGQAEICVATLALFRDILAAEAGNLALRVLATGGVYLGDGLPPRLLRFLKTEAFVHAFTDKGRFGDFLAQVPMHVIRNPGAALFGAACHGLELEGYHNGTTRCGAWPASHYGWSSRPRITKPWPSRPAPDLPVSGTTRPATATT